MNLTHIQKYICYSDKFFFKCTTNSQKNPQRKVQRLVSTSAWDVKMYKVLGCQAKQRHVKSYEIWTVTLILCIYLEDVVDAAWSKSSLLISVWHVHLAKEYSKIHRISLLQMILGGHLLDLIMGSVTSQHSPPFQETNSWQPGNLCSNIQMTVYGKHNIFYPVVHSMFHYLLCMRL